ncbi:AraC family transcriptional regulator ligand-binding domain-containing protein [Roseofilum reptotaenium CS-1145]|uniref:AraC family transcriptional regulator n=1 Tax=Roseofilum reptotaenium AO1-A TaxID=1925591 RepID=A0A1L9QW17_9CYAN|nr:AraC family transcriptional regulator [Roseofilum reptotaenium]MDB9518092.1 AraC family transcriptional regulator ligand-binding domain-containing protein [Roseofilum reptotaenium CS-1145]OJJ26829.1 AraC family transcriptional regulator [Roseofilum reptotaenium AO1-A]
MKKEIRFALSPGWRVLLNDLGVKFTEVLRRAELPLDLYARKDASLSTDEYFRFWRAIEFLLDDPVFPLQMIRNLSSEVFEPPIFAAYCSPNLNTALQRISQFKCLIGPMKLDVKIAKAFTNVQLRFLERGLKVPVSLTGIELGFFVQLARMATREPIVPLEVVAPCELPSLQDYADYFGVVPIQGEKLSISFSADDAVKPFLTENLQMWEFFEPELRKRLSEIRAETSMGERVRDALLEMLPSGQTSVDDLAGRLLISRRTLQRRLGDEGTSFKLILTKVREELARYYITKSELPYTQISLLLGYEDPNSFFRAFHSWTGTTPDRIRSQTSIN